MNRRWPAERRTQLTRDLALALEQYGSGTGRPPAAMLGVEGLVDSDLAGFRFRGAIGNAERGGTQRISVEHPLRLASNIKTYIAAAILKLHEIQRLELRAGIHNHIAAEHAEILCAGGYAPDLITIEQLLTHTSGLFDFGDSAVFDRLVIADPTRRWTRTDQLRGAMKWGSAYGSPGEVVRYSDTGYILLGEILERATKTSLATALATVLDYISLELRSTWLEGEEPPPPGVQVVAHQYWGPHDTFGWNLSFDVHGGGGLTATLSDLSQFWRALFEGRVFRHSSTLATMLTNGAAIRGGPRAYGRTQRPGAFRMGFDARQIAGVDVLAQGGFWGTFAAYARELGVIVTSAVTQQTQRSIATDLAGAALRLAAQR